MEPFVQVKKVSVFPYNMEFVDMISDIFDTFLRWPFFYLHPRRVELPILPVEQVIQS